MSNFPAKPIATPLPTKSTWYQERLSVYHWDAPQPRARLLLVHGLGEHSRRYGRLIHSLNEHGISVVACDLPGHGTSQGSRGDIPGFASLHHDLDGIRRELAEKTSQLPEFIYGHSLGGLIVLHYALHDQLRREARDAGPVTDSNQASLPKSLQGVIASSPMLRTAQPLPRWKVILATTVARWLPQLSLDNGLNPQDISSLTDEIRQYQVDPLKHSRISARLGRDMLIESDWLRGQAMRWRQPLLLMHGTEDRITSFSASQEFARSIGDLCEFVPWAGCRHELHHETIADEVFETVNQWLDRHIAANQQDTINSDTT